MIGELKSSSFISDRETSFRLYAICHLVSCLARYSLFFIPTKHLWSVQYKEPQRPAREPCSVYSLHNLVYFSQIHLMGDNQSPKLLCTACHQSRTWYRNIMFVFVFCLFFNYVMVVQIHLMTLLSKTQIKCDNSNVHYIYGHL